MKKILLLSFILLTLSFSKTNEEKIQWLLQKQKENMVFVKGGSYMMGDIGGIRVKDKYGYYLLATPENIKKHPNKKIIPIRGQKDILPLHKVILSDYYISKYLVTWKEFDTYYEVIEKKRAMYEDSKWRKPNYPVRSPSWYEAKNYCKFLAKHSGLNYDLPTEAQWEYAARSRGKYVFFGTDNGRAYDKEKTKYRLNEQNMMSDTTPIGTYPPNPLGLYDISGSGWQWVNDWYDEDYYKISPKSNPKGPKKGEKKVVRGGHGLSESVVFNRFYWKVDDNYPLFRCVLNP